MSRETSLSLARNKDIRNKDIRKAYDRLMAEESVVTCKGIKVVIKLNYQQAISVLAKMFYLSPRTVEPIITAYGPKMAPLTTAGQPSPQARK